MLALSIGHMRSPSTRQTARDDPEALFHLGQALQLANKSLRDPDYALSEPIFAVVTSLAITESSSGNLQQAEVHLGGLRRMLELKGGFSFLDGNRSLQQKIQL
jgi:hypothetical protein